MTIKNAVIAGIAIACGAFGGWAIGSPSADSIDKLPEGTIAQLELQVAQVTSEMAELRSAVKEQREHLETVGEYLLDLHEFNAEREPFHNRATSYIHHSFKHRLELESAVFDLAKCTGHAGNLLRAIVKDPKMDENAQDVVEESLAIIEKVGRLMKSEISFASGDKEESWPGEG